MIFGSTVATILVALVSLTTNHWIVVEGLTIGLWRTCIKEMCIFSTDDYPSRVAVIFYVLGIFLLMFSLFSMWSLKHCGKVTAVCSIELGFAVAGIFFGIAIGSYMKNYSEANFLSYGYSFVLGCVTCTSCFLLALSSWKVNRYETLLQQNIKQANAVS